MFAEQELLKNQVVWARCHFAGLASGTTDQLVLGTHGAARRSVRPDGEIGFDQSWARVPESKK
jgi:hypothetical protein